MWWGCSVSLWAQFARNVWNYKNTKTKNCIEGVLLNQINVFMLLNVCNTSFAGMVDIARQTVEFLYEENGGMPRDLHLPTIDDIREELAKFTIERVRKGTMVVIRQTHNSGAAGTTVLPKFAVRGMVKTFGLTGIVLDVDQVCRCSSLPAYMLGNSIFLNWMSGCQSIASFPPCVQTVQAFPVMTKMWSGYPLSLLVEFA